MVERNHAAGRVRGGAALQALPPEGRCAAPRTAYRQCLGLPCSFTTPAGAAVVDSEHGARQAAHQSHPRAAGDPVRAECAALANGVLAAAFELDSFAQAGRRRCSLARAVPSCALRGGRIASPVVARSDRRVVAGCELLFRSARRPSSVRGSRLYTHPADRAVPRPRSRPSRRRRASYAAALTNARGIAGSPRAPARFAKISGRRHVQAAASRARPPEGRP